MPATDHDYMKLALKLALKAKGRTSPNPLVGAVIVKNNRILATGFHYRCGADHAEIDALKKIQYKASGAKLYVTLEPCCHVGRTPPCVDVLISSGIKEVIIGMKDPNPLVSGKSIVKLRRAGIKVKSGPLEEELQKINEPFIKFITTKMPFVVAKSAQTLDGKIATRTFQSQWITNQSSRNYARDLRNDFDAILVGINTVLKDDPALNASKKDKKLKKIIVDTDLRISAGAKLFQKTDPQAVFIATTKNANKSKVDAFLKKGINVIICPQRDGQVDLKWLFKELAKREITYILVEGGSKIIGSALRAHLVDKMLIFIAPKIFGDKQALGSVEGLKTKRIDEAIPLKNLSFRQIKGDILIEGYVYRNR